MLCRASLVRSVLRQAVRPYASASPSLKELQDKYRTSASEILASIPHDGAEEEDENLEELYTQYYDNIGAQTNALIEKKKFQASKFYQELYDYYNAKIDRFDEPFYAATNFPILNEMSGNKPSNEEAFMDYLGELLGVPEREKEAFHDTVRNGEYQPDDSWLLQLDQDFNRILDETEDAHQDAIDSLEADFGSDNHNCELFELEKKHMMDAEEVEAWNRIAEMQKKIREKPIEKIPHLHDPFE